MWRLLVVFAFEKPNQAQRDRKRAQHAFENNAQNMIAKFAILICLAVGILWSGYSTSVLANSWRGDHFISNHVNAKEQMNFLLSNPIFSIERFSNVFNEFPVIIDRFFYFSNAGGVESLANILNCCDRGTEKNIMEWLDIENQKMAQEVRDLMFVFEDIIILDDRSIQRLLREIDTKQLALALKGTKDEIKEKIFKNMSERARQMLTDDMEYLGPVRAKEVQEAQTGIVNAIRNLEATGEITITRASVEDELIE